MSKRSLLSSQPDGHAFRKVFPLLVYDYAQAIDRLQTSSLEVPRRLPATVQDDQATRREHQQISRLLTHINRSTVALVDVDRTRQLEAALEAVTYRLGFEEVVVNDEKRPVSLCLCCKKFVRTRPNVFVNILMRYGNSDVGDDEEDEAFWENHHTTFFQLMDCCFISDRGCHLCHLIWQAFRVQRQQQRDPEAYKLTWHKGSFKLGVTRRMETVPRGHTLHLKSNIQIVSGNRTSRNSKGFDATILNLGMFHSQL